MGIFKRIEVWILLVLLGGGLIYVLTSGDSGNTDPDNAASPAKTDKYVIKKLTLRRDYGNYELRLAVDYNNKGGGEIETASAAALIAESGRKIPAFFLAISPPPIIPADKREQVELKYWLEGDDLKGHLWLDILGSKIQVKANAAFDGESVPNGETKTISLPEWSVK